jgi:hypothetical protein
MGKYSTRQAAPKPRPYDVHPVWRGIGCLLTLIGPPLAYATAHLLVSMNLERGWYPLPGELLNSVTIPGINFTITHVYADLLMTIVVMVAGVAILMVLYTALYGLLGPKRYGPLDSPPVRSTGGHKSKPR